MAPVPGDFAQLVVEQLDAVGGVDDPAQHRREGREGHEPVPGVGEGLDGRGVALTQLAAVKGVQGLHGGLLVGCLVDRPQPRADGFAVLVRHEPCGGPDQVDHAGLDGGLRPGGFDGLGQAGQPVTAHDQHVTHAAVGQLGTDPGPELGSFMGLDPNT